MHQVHIFLHLESKERLLLLETLAVVVAVRLGLWLLPFQKLRALVAEVGQRSVGSYSANSLPVEQIAWTIRAASQYVPRATCLTQALSGQVLLARRGHSPRLHIGVAKKSQAELEAHAWLECEGQVVLGDHGSLAVYTPFPSLE